MHINPGEKVSKLAKVLPADNPSIDDIELVATGGGRGEEKGCARIAQCDCQELFFLHLGLTTGMESAITGQAPSGTDSRLL